MGFQKGVAAHVASQAAVGKPAKAVNEGVCREKMQRPGLEYKVIITMANL